MAAILDLPFGERDVRVEALTETRSPIVKGTVGFAGRMVTQFDQKGSLKASLERARIPMKPGEFEWHTGSFSHTIMNAGTTQFEAIEVVWK